MVALIITMNSKSVDLGSNKIYQIIENDGCILLKEFQAIVVSVADSIKGYTFKKISGSMYIEILKMLENMYRKNIIAKYQSNDLIEKYII